MNKSRLKNNMVNVLSVMLCHGIGTPKTKPSEFIHSIRTCELYMCEVIKFVCWLISAGINPYISVDEASKYIQKYICSLEARGLAWATVHTALAALCKVCHKSMKRYKISIPHLPPKSGRKETKTSKLAEKRHPREAKITRMIGIRRADYLELKGRDFLWINGHAYVHVLRGKGGKEQYQLIFPEYAKQVEVIFRAVGPDEKVFSESSLRGLPLHRYRRELAQEMYFRYLDELENNPGASQEYKNRLFEAFRRANVNPYKKADMRRLDSLYVTQGAVKTSLEELGMPVKYNRLALMMTAVFHLSHWRTSVVVRHYMR